MNDRIDPGPGWRLLEVDEIRDISDESYVIGEWKPTIFSELRVFPNSSPTRRRINRYKKAIATRATVRCAFPDGEVLSDSIACKTGLSGEMMQYVSDRWNLASKHLPTSGARYIMLEIHREGEP